MFGPQASNDATLYTPHAMIPSERLAELVEGRNPALISRMRSGFLVMGDSQFLPGYCLLLAYPQVEKLNDLDGDARAAFLADMAAAGDAVLAATGCRRINYSIYGNLDPFLHAHIWPRYDWEDNAYRTAPPFSIPASIRGAPEHAFDAGRHRELHERIRREMGS
jgi:diadenosine tetraphosphate (Ap4A) HIT family hydrolase